jgi:DNA segregation ATPase FtsK/SpoIIIE-like protein
MRTFFARPWLPGRSTVRRGRHPATGRGRLPITRLQPRAQDGFLLLEVLVSSLMVGLIVVATLTGFDALTRSSAEQRRHDEAALLAAQSQQQMRSDPASALLAFKNGENSYTQTVAGTTYTILQKATFGNGSSQTGCSATETTKGQGTYILISTTVSWPHMVGKTVTESSLITPPTGSALDVEVSNGEIPTSGVSVLVKYIPAGSTSTDTLEGTTGAAGCVLFAGIPSTAATVEVKETDGIVNKYGTLSWPSQNFTLAPNVLVHDEVKLAPGGAITAEFAYEGATTYTHSNDAGTGTVVEAVTGDTFVAYNVEMAKEPFFEKGNTAKPTPFTGSLFEVLPGAPGSYAATATSPTELVKYPRGNLFPFPKPKDWTAYAGDCTANKPEEFDSAITSPTVALAPSEDADLKVPTTYVALDVYSESQAEVKAKIAKGEATWPALETTDGWLVTVTNKKCSAVTSPNNETAINPKSTQYTTIGSAWGGHLSAPFQPFGEYELCLATGTGVSGKSFKFHEPYVNKNPSKPVALNIYLNELTQAEKEAARATKEAETKKAREATEKATREAREATEKATREARVTSEAETKSKREASETPAREKRETEEKAEKATKTKEETTKTERLAKEAAEKTAWESEINKNSKSATEKAKEKKVKEEAQKTKREAAEATEKAAEKKRKEEESATATTKSDEETAKKAAETKEAETKNKEETKEAEKKSKEETKEAPAREAEEAKEATAKTEAVKQETTELKEKEDVVETGDTC